MTLEATSLFSSAAASGLGARLQVAQTCDVDEQAALLQGWNQNYEQISSGPFQGSVQTLSLGPILALQEFTNQALHQTGELGKGQVAVGLPLELQGNTMFCNQACSLEHAIVFSGETPFEFVSPGGLKILNFVVDAHSLHSCFTPGEYDALLAQLEKPHLRTVSAHEKKRLPILLADAQETMARLPEAGLQEGPVANMVHDLLSGVASVLLDGLGSDVQESLCYQRRANIVSMARDQVVGSGADGSATVESLCKELAVSRRALQYSFQEVLGISPQNYLRAVRLNGARRAIKQSSSVSDAAAAWGFWHFGRFSQEYKALFGELPSQTAKRFH
ncbi:helix-turn-helix domain-containing protein [Comamonas sp. J-3]|jgi:AraC family ethanolamine operon transcriptional activator|uniref:helix-turn-helix domain-containing protein n=1 Tax=Comamonas trifloxystrobinivorans TaxID=3350256 RepID=UPI003727F41E